MRKTTLLVTFAALALAGACGKGKDKDKAKADDKARTTTTPTTPVVVDAGPATPPAPPKKLEGEELARHFVECHRLWSAQDKAKFQDCYAKDATSRFADSMMPETKGAEAIAKASFDFHSAFPDGKTEPQLVLVNGRDIAAVLLFTGTNTAPMKMGPQELPPTGKKVGMHMLQLVSLDDANRVTQEWWIMDDSTFGFQLGINPPEAPPGRPMIEKGMDGAPNIVVASGSEVEQTNLAAFTKANEDFMKKDYAAMRAGWAEDGIESDQASAADTVGAEAIEKNAKMFLTAFPDAKITSLKSWAAGDYVVSVGTFSGTNTGNMGPMKATRKPGQLTIEVAKFDGGKVKQFWRFYNSYAMANQLGMVPPPGAGAPK